MPDLRDAAEAVLYDLGAVLDGRVLLPGTEEYEQARPVGQRFHHIRPAAVVRCRTAGDVAEALHAVRRAGLPVVVRSGGHDFAGRSTGTGVVLDLAGLDRVGLDGTRARVGVGARLAAVHRTLAVHGRAVPAGCGPTVGIGGLTLGGGLGVLGRMYGLLCDRLVAAEVVLADGSIVRCDEDRHGDLFWALRGGGAIGVGVATELVFETVPAPATTVYRLTWHLDHAADLVEAWQHWAPDAPDAVAASLLLDAPAEPARPATVTVLGSAAGRSVEHTARLLAGLVERAGAAPQRAWQHEASWLDTKTALAALGPGEDDGHVFAKSEYFRGAIPRPAVERLVVLLTTDRRPGEARELDLSPWGGAYNRTPADATAFPHRQERFLLKHGATVTPELRSEPTAWLEASWDLVHPHGSGGVYPNFPDRALPDPERAYWGPNVDRLRRIRAAYDPDGLLSSATPPRTAGSR